MKPIEGTIPYALFVARTDPSVVRHHLDIGNMALGGADPMQSLEKFQDRYWSSHVKDVVPISRGARLLSARAAVLGALLAVAGCAHLKPIDRAAWNADLDALVAHIPAGYANFEYSVRTLGLKPDSLRTATRARIKAARTEAGGRAAIASFLDAFGDYHISLSDASPASASENGPQQYASCKQLGFRNRDRTFHQAIRDQAGFTADDGGTLPTARIAANGRVVRAVRIPLFSQTQFRELCETLWPRAAGSSGNCDDRCATALFSAISDSVFADLRARLHSDSAALLIVDITGNGGGSEWDVEVARQLTAAALRSPSVGMVRHPHHQQHVADDANLRAAFQTPCDWSGVWNGVAAPACSPLVVDSGRVLAAASQPVWRGRLLILADRHTASASEEFTAILVDAGAAQVAGERTMGIGCGFTNGGIDFRLPKSGLAVRLPDCARFRRDGTNERAGIRPVVGIWSDSDDASARAAKLKSAIDALQSR